MIYLPVTGRGWGGRPSPGAPCSEKKNDESEPLDAPIIDKNMI